MIEPGTGWTGDYSRFTFDEAKRYLSVLKEQGKPVTDDEFNVLQDILLTAICRVAKEMIGDGSPNNGFLVNATGLNNDFTLTAGSIYVNGLRVLLPANVLYSAQEDAGPALTTPGGSRTDWVYLEAWLDEVDNTYDATIDDPTLALETSRRALLRYKVRVNEGGTVPADVVIDGTTHYRVPLARLARTATAAINSAMVSDRRGKGSVAKLLATHNTDPAAHPGLFDSDRAMVAYFARTTPPAGWLALDGRTIGNTVSGATSRDNEDTAGLFTILWDDWDDAILTIQDNTGAPIGRGASAASDFAAGKRLPLPDDRAYFWRGWDNARGIDTARAFGSFQADKVGPHTHPIQYEEGDDAGAPNFPGGADDIDESQVLDTPENVGDETVPKNRAYLACIRY